ncbi:MAG: hypothetical protein AAFY53_09755 [Pseudomonadota bacterium]
MLSLNDLRNAFAGRTTLRRSTAGAVITAALVLGGCTAGFAPMYAARDAGGAGLSEKLKSVSLATIPGRVGQQIRNELIFATRGGSEESVAQAYRLEISIRERKGTSLVDRTGDSIGQTYLLDANFRLINTADGTIALRGQSSARAAIQKFTTIYSNVRALRDAQDRAARTVATDLKVRLETFLATQV